MKSVQWGINNEEVAIKCFENEQGLKVDETGIWLDESGLLGASPDGLVGEDAILEIKCPFKHRAATSAKEVLYDHEYCFDTNGFLKETHPYYHQVQRQLHLLQRSLCYFVVWTPQFFISLKVEKNPEWTINIEKLKTFFKNYYLRRLMD